MDSLINDKGSNMTEKEAIRLIMKKRGWTQQRLADEAGYKGQTNIRSLLDPIPSDNIVLVYGMFSHYGE